MGRAIVRDPQVFLFDEPLSNLDAKLCVLMRTEIKELHQRLKTTTIYVTHEGNCFLKTTIEGLSLRITPQDYGFQVTNLRSRISMA
jgi:ABC-type sulfate/molybdate transport systems ATPase subunit